MLKMLRIFTVLLVFGLFISNINAAETGSKMNYNNPAVIHETFAGKGYAEDGYDSDTGYFRYTKEGTVLIFKIVLGADNVIKHTYKFTVCGSSYYFGDPVAAIEFADSIGREGEGIFLKRMAEYHPDFLSYLKDLGYGWYFKEGGCWFGKNQTAHGYLSFTRTDLSARFIINGGYNISTAGKKSFDILAALAKRNFTISDDFFRSIASPFPPPEGTAVLNSPGFKMYIFMKKKHREFTAKVTSTKVTYLFNDVNHDRNEFDSLSAMIAYMTVNPMW